MAQFITELSNQSAFVSNRLTQFGTVGVDVDEGKQPNVQENSRWNAIRMARNMKSSLSNQDITGRFRNKFEQGWLGGVGGDSQFQHVIAQVGLQGPKSSNDDLEARFNSTTSPDWNRSYAYAPGLGLDALMSRITWTSKSGGMDDPQTALVAPVINSGKDLATSNPIPALKTWNGAQGITQTNPVNIHGGENAGDIIYNTKGVKQGGYKPAPPQLSRSQKSVLSQQRRAGDFKEKI